MSTPCPLNSVYIDIGRDECIGNSLSKINNNFQNFKVTTCDNSASLDNFNQNVYDLRTSIAAISSIMIPGAAKAWVKFDGSRDEGGNYNLDPSNRLIYSSYKIDSVYKKTGATLTPTVSSGDYDIYFANEMADTNYVVVGTSSERKSATYGWLQPYLFATNFVSIRVHSPTWPGRPPAQWTNGVVDLTDPVHISVIIY
jgi:hypothetical protein